MALSSTGPSAGPTTTRPRPAPSFLTLLEPGAPHLDAPWPLPAYDPHERRAGDALLARLDPLLAGVDADEIDRTAALPDGLVEGLRAAGFLALRNSAALGGLAASDLNAFRVVESAAHTSVAVGQLLAVQNGVGAPALLAGLAPGPLADLVAGHVAAGTLSGFGGSEPAGQNNAWPATTATPAVDGAYVVDGEKLFTGNAPVAGFVAVTATVPEDGRRRAAVVFLETAGPGVEVGARHTFLGSRGLPNGSLRFTGVRVPGAQVVLAEEPDVPGFPAGIGRVAQVGQLVFNGAPALAVVRQSLRVQREFVARRTIDGRPLASYDAIRRIAAGTLATGYAADSVVRWCLGGGERGFELLLAKNVLTRAAWEIADRTVSVLGGEGLETAASKRSRGARPEPLERLLRDARGLRVSGNVDFLLDLRLGGLLLARHRAAGDGAPGGRAGQPATPATAPGPATDPGSTAARPATDPGSTAARSATGPGAAAVRSAVESWLASPPPPSSGAGLSAANRRHFEELARDLRHLGGICTRYAGCPAEPPAEADQEAARLIGRAAGELLAVFAVLARVGSEDARSEARQELADVHCSAARHRIDGLWRRLAAHGADPAPVHRSVSRDWFDTSDLDFLIRP
ncbi:acyl-CoA dehydrogenase family protein [Streptomyces sp. NPDC058457]|uniref:acyl-CoA dehydrogenase family protein n=1 Tax=Streptomyces sp. NPDC058457 TaxID=3346507 RepID=UPI00366576FD